MIKNTEFLYEKRRSHMMKTNKSLKKTILIVLIALIVLAFAACGDKSGGDSTSPVASPASADPVETKTYVIDNWADFPSALGDIYEQEKQRFEEIGMDAYAEEFFTCRIIVKATSTPDYSGFDPVLVIDGPNDYFLYQFRTPEEAEAFQKGMEGKDYVVYAEADQIFTYSDPVVTESDVNASVSAEGFHSWGVTYMQADRYADYLKDNGYTSQIVVAVVDSGVDVSHPFLSGRLVDWFDILEPDNNPYKGTVESKHGTHVSGTVVDCTPGLNVKIMPVRVMRQYKSTGEATGNSSYTSAGIYQAVESGADIINLSLGGPHSFFVEDAVDYAVSQGVVVCVAAGNNKEDTSNECPAHDTTPGCICVSAIDSSGSPAGFTNYGSHVDVAAPGVYISSSLPGGEYGLMNGTSMATPHISAAAAMYKLRYPSASPAEIEQYVCEYVKDLYDTGRDDKTGVGVPQMGDAISAGDKTANTVTVVKGAGIDSVSGGGSYEPGDKVTVSATVSGGYRWSGWTSSDASRLPGSSSRTYTFTMPAGNVTLTASAVSSSPDTTAAPAVPSVPSTKQEIIDYYTAAYNRIGSNAKTVTRTYLSFSNYRNIVEIGKNDTINKLVKSLMDRYMVENTAEMSGTVTNLPPKGVSTLSISTSQIDSATIRDNGSTYTVVLTSTGSDSNYETNAQPGRGSAGVIGPLVDNNDIYDAAPKFNFTGLNAKYAKASVTATVDKATGYVTQLEFDTPCVVYCSSVGYPVLGKEITLNDPQVGVEIRQTWKLTY